MTIDGAISSVSDPTAFTVKVAESQEDQHEKVVKTLLESVEATSPAKTSPAGFRTGTRLNITA